MDNRQFNINGRTKKQLTLAVKCLLLSEYDDEHTVKGWYFSKKRGFVLCSWASSHSNYREFTNRLGEPEEVGAEELVEILWKWLESDEASTVELDGWDIDMDHDGSNGFGWRLYVNEWGHVNNDDEHTIDHSSIAAFKKVYLWYGK